MSDPRDVFSAEERALLDAYVVPPPAAGWADRVMAAVESEALPPLPRPRPSQRLRFLRRGLYGIMTVAGAAVVTAAAAEQGLLGSAARQQVQAVVAAALGPAGSERTPPARSVARPPAGSAAPATPPASPAAAPPVPGPEQLAPIVERLRANPVTATKVDRYLQRRAQRQEARGAAPTLPDLAELARQYRRLPPARRQQLREDLQRLPPEDRAEILGLIRQYRASRRQGARSPADPGLAPTSTAPTATVQDPALEQPAPRPD